jgi:predicted secreted protein
MTIATGLVLYFITYWTVLFAILPWGNKAPDVPEDGQFGGAPINPRLKQKFIITAIVSAILWVIMFFLIEHKVIDFRSIATHMSEEDLQK